MCANILNKLGNQSLLKVIEKAITERLFLFLFLFFESQQKLQIEFVHIITQHLV